MPQEFTRFGSVTLANPGWSDTRLVCVKVGGLDETDAVAVVRPNAIVMVRDAVKTRVRILRACLTTLTGVVGMR